MEERTFEDYLTGHLYRIPISMVRSPATRLLTRLLLLLRARRGHSISYYHDRWYSETRAPNLYLLARGRRW
jgi:hypothetical protein